MCENTHSILSYSNLHKHFVNSLLLEDYRTSNFQLRTQPGYLCCLRYALRSYVRRLWGIWGCLVGPSHEPAAATFFAPAYENPIPTDDTGHELLAHSFGTSQSGTSRITPKMHAGESQIRWDFTRSLLNQMLRLRSREKSCKIRRCIFISITFK